MNDKQADIAAFITLVVLGSFMIGIGYILTHFIVKYW